MLIRIEGVDYKIPVSLMEVTLSDRISYDNTHGKELKDKLKTVLEKPEGWERDYEMAIYHCDVACKTLSYFGNIAPAIIEETAVEDILVIYHQFLKDISGEINYSNAEFELKREFTWKDAEWEIQPPELKNGSRMTAGEFIDAKQTVKQLAELGNDNWESLLMLCCIYFRKKGEAYNMDLLDTEGERYQLMKSLPLMYALHVGFFLSGSMSSYTHTLNYSSLPETLESLS